VAGGRAPFRRPALWVFAHSRGQRRRNGSSVNRHGEDGQSQGCFVGKPQQKALRAEPERLSSRQSKTSNRKHNRPSLEFCGETRSLDIGRSIHNMLRRLGHPCECCKRMGTTGRKRTVTSKCIDARPRRRTTFKKSRDRYEKMQKIIAEGNKKKGGT